MCFLMKSPASIPAQRIVHLSRGELPYDFLILATGIQYNYFGHEEWRRHAPGLESLDDADVIRSKILCAFERAEEMASIENAGKGRDPSPAYFCPRRWGDGRG